MGWVSSPPEPGFGAAVREASKSFFGQEHRLAVMLAVGRHPTGEFTLSELAGAVGVTSPSSIQGPVAALLRAGLISRKSTGGVERVRWYERQNSSAWAFAEELHRQVLTTRPEGGLPLW